MSEVYTKNRIIWDTNSINIWILADDGCHLCIYYQSKENFPVFYTYFIEETLNVCHCFMRSLYYYTLFSC